MAAHEANRAEIVGLDGRLAVAREGRLALLEELHRRQGAMYAGGPLEPVAEMLSDDVVWHVPGTSAIAGDHAGREAVLAYFERRRGLATNALRLRPAEALEAGDLVVQIVDGAVALDDRSLEWRTVGVYRFAAERVAEAWLVPADLTEFDRIWKRLGAR